jgi:hypothetical protein
MPLIKVNGRQDFTNDRHQTPKFEPSERQVLLWIEVCNLKLPPFLRHFRSEEGVTADVRGGAGACTFDRCPVVLEVSVFIILLVRRIAATHFSDTPWPPYAASVPGTGARTEGHRSHARPPPDHGFENPSQKQPIAKAGFVQTLGALDQDGLHQHVFFFVFI